MAENLVLYRKYRPQDFDEVIGQEHIVKTLQNSLSSGSISHAYLFCGPRGSGKTTIARIFAKELGCDGMDLVEIDAASHTGVEDVRALIEGLQFAPVKSKYKVFIIDECHQLSKSAANALLKTLEEPPTHTIFILATTEASKMLATIVSRCQRFDFKRLHVSEIEKKLAFILKKEGILAEPAVLPLIALNARGSFRDAESLLDKCISFTAGDKLITVKEIKELLGIVEVGQISKLVDFLLVKNSKDAIGYINAMLDSGVDLQEATKTLVFYLRQCLLLKINPEFLTPQNSGLSKEELEVIVRQITGLTEKNIQAMLEIFIEAEQKMKYATILQLPLELAVVEICSA